jgi:hypothetical protein
MYYILVATNGDFFPRNLGVRRELQFKVIPETVFCKQLEVCGTLPSSTEH